MSNLTKGLIIGGVALAGTLIGATVSEIRNAIKNKRLNYRERKIEIIREETIEKERQTKELEKQRIINRDIEIERQKTLNEKANFEREERLKVQKELELKEQNRTYEDRLKERELALQDIEIKERKQNIKKMEREIELREEESKERIRMERRLREREFDAIFNNSLEIGQKNEQIRSLKSKLEKAMKENEKLREELDNKTE